MAGIIHRKKIKYFLTDRLSFLEILGLWLLFSVTVGVAYYVFSTDLTTLRYSDSAAQVTLMDSIYFSLVSATSSGYGDILPSGFFKFIAVSEVLVSLLLIAIVTSKLISIKQTAILKEIYDISHGERMNRLRSAMHLFRIDIRKIAVMAEKKIITKREISELVPYLTLFNDTMTEFKTLLGRKADVSYIKSVNRIELELMLNSVSNSLKRIKNALLTLNSNNYKWKSKSSVKALNQALTNSDSLFKKVLDDKKVSNTDIAEFYKEAKEHIKNIKKLIK